MVEGKFPLEYLFAGEGRALPCPDELLVYKGKEAIADLIKYLLFEEKITAMRVTTDLGSDGPRFYGGMDIFRQMGIFPYKVAYLVCSPHLVLEVRVDGTVSDNNLAQENQRHSENTKKFIYPVIKVKSDIDEFLKTKVKEGGCGDTLHILQEELLRSQTIIQVIDKYIEDSALYSKVNDTEGRRSLVKAVPIL